MGSPSIPRRPLPRIPPHPVPRRHLPPLPRPNPRQILRRQTHRNPRRPLRPLPLPPHPPPNPPRKTLRLQGNGQMPRPLRRLRPHDLQYHEQLDHALAFLSSDSRIAWRAAQQNAMKSAAAELNFEQAAKIKSRLNAPTSSITEAFSHLQPFAKFRLPRPAARPRQTLRSNLWSHPRRPSRSSPPNQKERPPRRRRRPPRTLQIPRKQPGKTPARHRRPRTNRHSHPPSIPRPRRRRPLPPPPRTHHHRTPPRHHRPDHAPQKNQQTPDRNKPAINPRSRPLRQLKPPSPPTPRPPDATPAESAASNQNAHRSSAAADGAEGQLLRSIDRCPGSSSPSNEAVEKPARTARSSPDLHR